MSYTISNGGLKKKGTGAVNKQEGGHNFFFSTFLDLTEKKNSAGQSC